MNTRKAVEALERRMVHLQERIADREARSDWRGLSYDHEELAALRLLLSELASKDALTS